MPINRSLPPFLNSYIIVRVKQINVVVFASTFFWFNRRATSVTGALVAMMVVVIATVVACMAIMTFMIRVSMFTVMAMTVITIVLAVLAATISFDFSQRVRRMIMVSIFNFCCSLNSLSCELGG